MQSTTGHELTNVGVSLLEKNGLKIENIRDQGYDGAANMSGPYKGLQSRILHLNEKGLYVLYHAHCLNLVLVEVAKVNRHFVSFFNIIEKLHTFISGSGKLHATFVQTQQSCSLLNVYMH